MRLEMKFALYCDQTRKITLFKNVLKKETAFINVNVNSKLIILSRCNISISDLSPFPLGCVVHYPGR